MTLSNIYVLSFILILDLEMVHYLMPSSFWTLTTSYKGRGGGKRSDQSNFCLIWLLEYHFVQLEELRMIICIGDVSLLNQHWASVQQLTGEALIGLKAHLVWFILNILYASKPLKCNRKDVKSLSFCVKWRLSVWITSSFLSHVI